MRNQTDRRERLRRAAHPTPDEKRRARALQHSEATVYQSQLLCSKCGWPHLDFCERVQMVHQIARIDERGIIVMPAGEIEPHEGIATIHLRCARCGDYSRLPNGMKWQYLEGATV